MLTHLERVLEVVGRPDREMDIAEAALWIAREEYPELDVPTYLGEIERLAENASRRMSGTASVGDMIFSLNHYLFQEQGFSGNTADFYDPRNSFLNHVLELRRGVPVTLAILYISIGRILGLPLQGVAFPGHFLVKMTDEREGVLLDPFAGGTHLQPPDLEAMLLELYGEAGPRTRLPQLLVPAGKRETILRMLRNLKSMYLQKNRPEKALWPIEYILCIAPEELSQLRDRGLIYEHLEYHSAAAADFSRYLELAGRDAEDAVDVRNRLIELQYSSRWLH